MQIFPSPQTISEARSPSHNPDNFKMPAIRPGSLVVVSGANGFIASHIVDQLLQAGFVVRGTVRDASKADWLKDYVASSYDSSKFEIAVVPDMSAEGAFDKAARGKLTLLPLLSHHPMTPIR